MKKYLLTGIILFSTSLSFAARKNMIVAPGDAWPKPGTLNTEAIYYSSSTCANSDLGNILISTTPGHLYLISVSSPGVGSYAQVFDVRGSTTSSNSKVIKSYLNTSISRDHFMNVYFSSALAVSNQPSANGNAGVPGCIDIIYTER